MTVSIASMAAPASHVEAEASIAASNNVNFVFKLVDLSLWRIAEQAGIFYGRISHVLSTPTLIITHIPFK